MSPPVAGEEATLEWLLSVPKEIRSDLATVWQMIYDTKYNGPVTFHCHFGQPKTVQILPPQIRLSD